VADSPLFLNLLNACRDNAPEIRKEAIWCISNIFFFVSDKARIERLVEHDLMLTLIDMLQKDYDSGHIVSLALSCVNSLLTKSGSAMVAFNNLSGLSIV